MMESPENQAKPISNPSVAADPDPLGTRSTALANLSWYLMAVGFLAIAAAGLFLFLREIRYQDYVLNGAVLGRYLLMAGVASYFAGRIITYYRKFRKKAGTRGLDD